jgi:outer membrane biosynthesis protein TonB
MSENNKFVIRIPRTDLTKPMEAGVEAIKGAQDLIRKFGAQVEPALYGLLCDTQSPNRQAVDKALKNGGAAASAVLLPLLIKDYNIAPAIATMVAAVTVQAIATVGQEKLCQAMAAAGADKQPVVVAKPEPDSKPKPKPRPKPTKPKPTKPKPKPTKPSKPRSGTKKKDK